jgi:hypothetical protein
VALERRTPLPAGSKPLKRGKPLEQGSKGLQRGAGLARGTAPLKRTAKLLGGDGPARTYKQPKAAATTGPAADVRAVVIARDQATCQRCGAPGSDVQHRQGRGSGGRGKAERERTNGPAWLVVLCGQGNTSGCHRAVDEDRETAEAEGFVIRRNGPEVDAATVPVKTYRGWRLLLDDGRSIRAQDVTRSPLQECDPKPRTPQERTP